MFLPTEERCAFRRKTTHAFLSDFLSPSNHYLRETRRLQCCTGMIRYRISPGNTFITCYHTSHEPPLPPLHVPASSSATRNSFSSCAARLASSRALERPLNHRSTTRIREDMSVWNHLYQPGTGRALWLHAQHLHKWYHSTRLVTSSRTHCESSLYDKYSWRQTVNRSRRPISSRSTIGPGNGLTIASTPSLPQHMRTHGLGN